MESAMNDRRHDQERRGNPRMPLQLSVSLYFNSLMLLDCRTRDISPEGAYVDTGGEILPHSADIDMNLRIDVDGRTLQHRLPAQVTRIDETGVGLSFRHDDYRSFSDLVALLNIA
jgi:hypothetical protein